MARPFSPHTRKVRDLLVARLRDGFHPPGQRFLSNRAIASQFGVSYQTAHRLAQELQAEGFLDRRPASGSYVAGSSEQLSGVQLVFHPRAQRPGSFGARLLGGLRDGLAAGGVRHHVVWAGSDRKAAARWLPVVWECPAVVSEFAAQRRFVVLLNDRPPPGLAATYVDSVSTNDFSGGAAAAELLRKVAPPRRLAALAGPRKDPRCQQRIAGLRVHAPKARVYWSPTWYAEDARRIVPQVVAAGWAGVFCANDRLAEALLGACAAARVTPPAIVGFDDAPVAAKLGLSTIAVPWAEITRAAVAIVQRRLRGDVGPTSQLIFSPRPIVRQTTPRVAT